MKEKMRVAQVIYALKRDGGAESLQLTLAEWASAANIDLTIITTRHRDPEVRREVEARGVRVVTFPGRKLVDPRRVIQAVAFARKEKFDVIHTHLTEATVIGSLAGKASQTPVVVTLHNVVEKSQFHLYHGRLEAWLINHWVSQVIAVGKETALAQAQRLHRQNIRLIPNAVRPACEISVDVRAAARREIMGDASGLALIAVGRLTKQKGFADLLTAFSRLIDTNKEHRLAIVGRGPLERFLLARIKALGLSSHVKLLGLRADVPVLMSASDIYVSSSLWEGLPLSVLEAMSVGLPVVATHVGDIPEVVGERAGLVVPAGDTDALANALRCLSDDVVLRRNLALAAKARVTEKYSAKRWVESLRGIYEDVVSAHRVRAVTATR